MKRHISLLLLLQLLILTAFAEVEQRPRTDANIFGHVVDKKTGEHLPFVTLLIKNTRIGSTTDFSGHYYITNLPVGRQTLIVQYVGYERAEVEFEIREGQTLELDVELSPASLTLEQVVVTGTMKEVSLKDSPVKAEIISARVLSRAPSANIMESIGAINGLQETVNCGVCGTNEIRINGLEGPNTAVLIDGMPIMGALASVYGLNGIPTEMIDRIEVIKGPSSTLYGSEAIGGVINVITKSPERAPYFAFNSFVSSDLEKNMDFGFTPKMEGNARMLLGGNIYMMENFIDRNKDGFSDVVLVKPRVSLFNKWSFKRPENRRFELAAKYYHENRFGGTRDFLGQYTNKANDPFRGNDSIYGETVFTNRLELTGSYQLPVPNQYMRLDFSLSHHDQDSYYGDMAYQGRQNIAYSNLIWNPETFKSNDLLIGLAARFQDYSDNTDVMTENDGRQVIPGVFAQNEYAFNKNLRLLGGLRWDYFKNHGNIFSPRLSFLYKPATFTTLRLNSGTGFRVINVFSEDHASISGFRQVSIAPDIKPEKSVNASFNLNHIFNLGKGVYTFDADVFYTHFSNKIIADYNSDPTRLIYENLSEDEYAISRGVSLALTASWEFPLSYSAGVTFQDVFIMEKADGATQAEKAPVLLSPAFTGTWALSYEIRRWRLSFDYTGTFTGRMHLPEYEAPFNRETISKPYSLHHFQFTRRINQHTSFYGAVKNIFDFTQKDPLIDAGNPFGPDFDTAYVYGPLQGRRFIIGVRTSI